MKAVRFARFGPRPRSFGSRSYPYRSQVRGFWLARWFARQAPERVGQAIGEVMHLLVSGVLHPAVEAEYELADFREAVVHTARSGRRGKVLLTG